MTASSTCRPPRPRAPIASWTRRNCWQPASKCATCMPRLRIRSKTGSPKIKQHRMNLLITGGAGFIGSNVIHHVIDRPEVTKLVNLDCLTYAGHLGNLTKVSSHPKYTFEKVDLRDKAETLRVVRQYEITHVMHLAAESH